MNSVLDNSLVALALLASTSYALFSLGPRSLRKKLLAALGGFLSRAPIWLGLGSVAQRLVAASAAKAQGACGGCENCGSEDSSTAAAGAEIKIPIAKIGRRA
jgi:hypothetical protein